MKGSLHRMSELQSMGDFRMPLSTRQALRLLASAALVGLTGLPALAQEAPVPGSAPVTASPAATADTSPAPAPASEDYAPEAKPSVNLTALREAIDLYRKGDLAGGDRARAALDDAPSRALAEWLAIRHGGA